MKGEVLNNLFRAPAHLQDFERFLVAATQQMIHGSPEGGEPQPGSGTVTASSGGGRVSADDRNGRTDYPSPEKAEGPGLDVRRRPPRRHLPVRQRQEVKNCHGPTA